MKLHHHNPRLDELHEAAARASANLVELEIEPTHQLLVTSALKGESAVRWSQARTALAELWRWQGLLERLLEDADKLGRSPDPDQLHWLLEEASIELSSSDVPLSERRLLAGPEASDRCSADQLLAGMSIAFDEVNGVVSRVGRTWETLIPRLDEARRVLAEASSLADQLGEPLGPERGFARALDALQASVTDDPLSVADADIDGLIAGLETTRAELAESLALKSAFEANLNEARELLERVRSAVQDSRAAHHELVVKIAASPPDEPHDSHSELEAGLNELAELGKRGSWREARRARAAWSAQAMAVLDQTQREWQANRAPIEARNRFRALLDAYRFKAKALGCVEEPRLADIFDRAHAELYTAPTDLELAAQLVRSYQQAVSASQMTPETMT